MITVDSRNQHRIAWGQICLDSYQLLRRSARRFAKGNVYDAEDLVQETVMRVLTYSNDPKTIENPLKYLVRMMRNVWHDKRVKQGALMLSLDDSINGEELETQLPVIAPDALRILENLELTDQLSFAAVTLTERERLLLKWHVEGLSAIEIAKRLDDQIERTRYQLNAVLAKVRYRLKKPRANSRRNHKEVGQSSRFPQGTPAICESAPRVNGVHSRPYRATKTHRAARRLNALRGK